MDEKRICGLLQNLVNASKSERNQFKALRWAQSPLARRFSELRDAPPAALLSKITEPTQTIPRIPYTLDLQLAMYAKILNFSLTDYFQDLGSFLISDLELQLYRFENFDDDTYLSPTIRLSYAFVPILEISMYGMTPRYASDSTPWCEGEPIISREKDLDVLPQLDFFNSGLMPKVHKWYREVKRIVADLPVSVDFPAYVMGVFGLALRLRGFEQLLIDMYDRPAFVHRLMRRLVNDRKQWESECNRFLGLERNAIILDNDDVGSPTLSANLYKEFVWPYEVELARSHGGISYWHSCNCTDKLLDLIKKIPGLQVFHVGPWNDIPISVEAMTPEIGLEVCLNPEEIIGSSEDELHTQLRQLVDVAKGKPITLRADCFQTRHDLQTDLKLIKRWAGLAREMTGP